ncbi:MAG TPA: glutamate--tRNA ligase [Chloroflexota bacterium]|nr:glutamate--tRNA ligase [Chloroflexota bacterium]
MAGQPVRVRIAPSPTGDPHVGTAYMALFDLAFARQQGGQFILRIEDTDRSRYVENSEQQIFDSLRWLGLDWDEGPEKGGPCGPYRQSERLALYQDHARRLVETGHAYECWCSAERLDQVRAAQRASGQPTRYDRCCLGKAREQRALEPGFTEKSVIRMLVPDHPPLVFDDLIRGETGAPSPDDQVLLKSDGFPTYHLAVVVDDHLMEITHVTRGEEWISSTPKQLLLYGWFGWEPPKFAHFPLLRNTDRSKISKRKNPAARLHWFKEQGFLPEALLNFLALMGFSMPDGREIFSFPDLVDRFDWSRFSPVGPIFDGEKLDWLNGQYVQALPEEDFLRRIQPYLPNGGEEDALRRLLGPLRERTRRLSDIRDQVDFLFADQLHLDTALLLKQGFDRPTAIEALSSAENLVRAAEPLEPAVLEEAFNLETERRGWKRRNFFMTVRVAATGKTATPPLFDTIAALGRDRTVARLADARAGLVTQHSP